MSSKPGRRDTCRTGLGASPIAAGDKLFSGFIQEVEGRVPRKTTKPPLPPY